MSSRVVSYRLSIALSCIFLVASAYGGAAENPELDVFDLLSGEWADNKDFTCASNPHVITFSADRKLATFSYQEPPDRSHWPPSLHAYSLSPEDSRERTIVFRVLDRGQNWLALQRQDATDSDGTAKPQTWKIRLRSDDSSYIWHLYGAVARKNSLLRGIRCDPKDKLIQEESDLVAESNLDDVLSRLVGTWDAPGRIMGRPVTYRAEGKAILQVRFIRIELKDLSVPARYEAIIIIGESEDQDYYIAHWLDVFGADASRIVGGGEYAEDELTIRFEQTGSTVIHLFRLHRSRPLRTDRFDLLTQSIDNETQVVSEVAAYEFKKVDAR